LDVAGTIRAASINAAAATNVSSILYAGGFTTNANTALLSFQTQGGGGGTVEQRIVSRFTTGDQYGLSIDDVQNSKLDNLRVTNGKVGVNCNAPAYTLDVNGLSHQSNNSASWFVASDRRIKTDILHANIAICASSIKALPLRYYQYDSNVLPERQDKHVIGCIAQEVQSVFPFHPTSPVPGSHTIL
jgi:hypothetical protein